MYKGATPGRALSPAWVLLGFYFDENLYEMSSLEVYLWASRLRVVAPELGYVPCVWNAVAVDVE